MSSRTSTIAVTAGLTFLLTSILWVVGIATYRWISTGIPGLLDYERPGFVVEVEAPAVVDVGETLDLVVEVSNPTDTAIELGSIDIYHSLLEGFQVLSLDPLPVDEGSSDEYRTAWWEETLSPGGDFRYQLELRAVKAGTWTGDVDACTPEENYVTRIVTIHVEGDGAPEPSTEKRFRRGE